MQLPARIGKYELEEFLGGGMSHVYRARDTVIGRTVAVKILTEAGCQDAEAKARFLAEARMAGNIAHDNVISIFDFGEDDQHRPFMVMEFLRGEDLRHAIKNSRTGDLTSKLKIALQVARALQYIHTQKIIHRDIKPENIHVDRQRRGEADGLRHRQDRRSGHDARRLRAGDALLHGARAGDRPEHHRAGGRLRLRSAAVRTAFAA